MKFTTTTNRVLSNQSSDHKLAADSVKLIKTYDLNEYIKQNGYADDVSSGLGDSEWSHLELSPEVKDRLKDTFWRTWYHLKHVQAGPFAVYNNPTPIDINGMFPVQQGDVGVQQMAPAQQVVPAMAMGAGQALAGAPATLPGGYSDGSVPVAPVQAVVPQVVTQPVQSNGKVEELNNSLETKAVPTDLSVGSSHSGDPNTPPLASIPVVNVIGGKTISAPGVIPSEVMEKHPMFDSKHLTATEYFRVNVENVGRSIIVVALVVFLVLVCVWRIRTRSKPKKRSGQKRR